MALLEGSRLLKDLIPILDAGHLAAMRLNLIRLGLILVPNGIGREYRLQVRPEPASPAALERRGNPVQTASNAAGRPTS